MFFEDLELPDLVKSQVVVDGNDVAVPCRHQRRRHALPSRHVAHHAAVDGAADRPAPPETAGGPKALEEEVARLTRKPARMSIACISLRQRTGTGVAAPVQGALGGPDRHAVPPLHPHAEAVCARGDVLPDGRVRLHVRKHEGSGQALLPAAARIPGSGATSGSTWCSSAIPRWRRRSRRRCSSPTRAPAAPWCRPRWRNSPASSGSAIPAASWNIYAAQASDGDNSGSDTAACRGHAGKRHPASSCSISPISRCRSLPRSSAARRICGVATRRLADRAPKLAMRRVAERQGHLPGLPRPVRPQGGGQLMAGYRTALTFLLEPAPSGRGQGEGGSTDAPARAATLTPALSQMERELCHLRAACR